MNSCCGKFRKFGKAQEKSLISNCAILLLTHPSQTLYSAEATKKKKKPTGTQLTFYHKLSDNLFNFEIDFEHYMLQQ